MRPRPRAQGTRHRGSGELQGKVAIMTGGDSGIGRAVAIAFAKEGADVSIVYLEERKDANETRHLVEEHGVKCLLIEGDVGRDEFCRKAVGQTVKKLGKLDILVNNAAEQVTHRTVTVYCHVSQGLTCARLFFHLYGNSICFAFCRALPRPSSDHLYLTCLQLPTRGVPLLCC